MSTRRSTLRRLNEFGADRLSRSLNESVSVEDRRKRQLKAPSILPVKDYESLDYDTPDNVPLRQQLGSYSKFTYWHVSIMRWVLVALIGFFTGLTAFVIDMGIFGLRYLKYSVVYFGQLYPLLRGNGMIFLALLPLVALNVVFALCAGILVAVEPIAAGSGIPEIKCYLNGIRMPRVARLRTLIAKAIGVMFSVGGGFLVGKEGPMIHSGAIIGAGIPQFRTFIWKKLKLPYDAFRNDKDKRDFVSCGAAAGVAAAFGAPIGGVLFSLEEGSSFWDQSLTWRSLFCAMCSTLTLNFFLTISPIVNTDGQYGSRIGQLDRPGLIDFGRFYQGINENLWSVQYLLLFIVMGAIGGLLGAWFNSLNQHLTVYRLKHVFRKHISIKILEVLLIATVTSCFVFLLSTLLGTCVPLLPSNNVADFTNSTRDYFCPDRGVHVHTRFSEPPRYYKYYNDMATLIFNNQEDTIKQLFHQSGAFMLATLFLAFIVYYFIACWTYGSGVPSGLFVPCLTIGALFGRFVIAACRAAGWLPGIYPGTFALIGAAAFLGGVVRMTVSLTVILLESTDEIEYGLPLLVTLMVAKWVGDLFNEGLYDIHIELKEIPFLGWDSPESMDRLEARDVMNKNIKYIYPVSRVRSIEKLLRTTAHNAFFVVTPLLSNEEVDEQVEANPEAAFTPNVDMTRKTWLHRQSQQNLGLLTKRRTLTGQVREELAKDRDTTDVPLVLHGIILRSSLVTLLKHRAFFPEANGPQTQPEVSQKQLNAEYPRFSSVFDVKLVEDERNMLMDVSPYMNHSPYTTFQHSPLPRVFNLFRTMGLRHLPVIEESGIVMGMITRHDLTHEHLHDVLHAKATSAHSSLAENYRTCDPTDV